MQSFYANVLSLRVTGQELVLEFGTHFPDKPGPPTGDYKPDVRIILAVQILPQFAGLLEQAVKGQIPQPDTTTAH